ncbi:MAG: DUF3168 domain-containing protein [Sphingobium sp.]
MSAELAIRAAVVAALKGDAMLMDGINALFDGLPARASAPYAVVGDCTGSQWGAKDIDGREIGVAISLHDARDGPARLEALVARVDPALQAMTRAGGGWRIVTARPMRCRIARIGKRGEEGWQAVIDYRIRAVREDQEVK